MSRAPEPVGAPDLWPRPAGEGALAPAEPGGDLLLSVVIPTHDRPEALRACLDRLAAQRLPCARFEVVVVDDGSPRPVAPLVAAFGGRLQVTALRQPQSGPAAARNHGALRARGRYVAFIDDDCLAEPGWLAAIEAAFRAHPRGVVLGGEITNPYETNACAEVGELILRVLLERYRPERGGVYFFRTANLAVARDDFLAAGGFDASFDTAEDREFCDRWLQRGGALVRVPPAAVSHASPLTLRGFLHRHYRYGRGAYRFHRLRRHRGSGRYRAEFVWYYLFVLQACLASRRLVARKVALVVLWQACNLFGFVAELLSRRRDRTPAGGAA